MYSTGQNTACILFVKYLQICQQKMIQGKTDEEDVKIAASIEIQRVWRGHFTR